MRRIVLLIGALAVPVLLVADLAGASTGDVQCAPPGTTMFIGKVNVAHNLIVAPGTSCGPTQGSTIGHDVIVQQGGSFFPGGTKIGHDVLANRASLIELGDVNNGTTDTIVGHDVRINRTQGPAPFGNFICQTRIGHDLVISNTAASASEWDIGRNDPANCGRNEVNGSRFGDTIKHDGTFTHNANSLEVGDNTAIFNGNTGPGFGHDLTITDNHSPSFGLIENSVRHACRQAHNHGFSGQANVVLRKKSHTNCNTKP
jgi:hypothetical protein